MEELLTGEPFYDKMQILKPWRRNTTSAGSEILALSRVRSCCAWQARLQVNNVLSGRVDGETTRKIGDQIDIPLGECAIFQDIAQGL